MPTGTAAFATGVPPINFDQCTSIPLRFVRELTHKLSPACIADSAGQSVIAHHIFDGQRLDADRLVLTDQAPRQLMQAILTLVGNLGVDARHLAARLLSVLGAFDLAAQGLLSAFQSFVALVGTMPSAPAGAWRFIPMPKGRGLHATV